MPARTGRLEKRVKIEVPLQLSRLPNPGDAEKAITENVSSHGIRVLTSSPLQEHEFLEVTLISSATRMQARVVYCQGLPNGRFVAGLQLQDGHLNWKSFSAGAT